MPPIRILSKAEIAELQDLPEEVVEIPEWGEGVGVLVRGMSAGERLRFVEETRGADGTPDNRKAMYMAIILGVKDPQFTEEDIPILEKRNPVVLDRISKVWLKLSGIGEDAVLEARKNS